MRWIRYLFFRADDIFTHPYKAAAFSGFSTLSAFSFNSSVSIMSLITIESISSSLTSSLLSLLVFLVFSKPFWSCKKKKKKKLLYTSNLKRLFTNKKMNSIVLKRVLLYMIKGCKSTPPPTFLKNCFTDQPYH